MRTDPYNSDEVLDLTPDPHNYFFQSLRTQSTFIPKRGRRQVRKDDVLLAVASTLAVVSIVMTIIGLQSLFS